MYPLKKNGREMQCLVRSEAFIAGAVLVAAPFLLRLWAKAEANHHDTLECRSVLQTYLIAGFGWVCAVLAAVAFDPVYAVRLQVCGAVRCGEMAGAGGRRGLFHERRSRLCFLGEVRN